MYAFIYSKNEEITSENIMELIVDWRSREMTSVFSFVPGDYMILMGAKIANKLHQPKYIYDIISATSPALLDTAIMLGKISELPRSIVQYTLNPAPTDHWTRRLEAFNNVIKRIYKPTTPTDFDGDLFNIVELSPLPSSDIMRKPKKVIFNDPATIVYWPDGSKTVVKSENESFDPEKGLAMAIAKKYLGNEGNYYDVFRKWLPEEKGCFNCKYLNRCSIVEPCRSCRISEANANWKKV